MTCIGSSLCHWRSGWQEERQGKNKVLKDPEWNALSPEAQSKIIEARKKGNGNDEDDKSVASNKLAKTIKSLSMTMHSLEKDNRLKKLVNALQKCNEDDNIDSLVS
jgi:hypothetical protein